MKLEELIQKRFVSTAALAERLTTYNGVPAVFSPEAPGDEQEGWGGETQYPMVTYNYGYEGTFGTALTTDAMKEAIAGGAKTIIACRVGNGGTQGSIKLQDSESTDAVSITAKYPGAKDFVVTVREKLSDSTLKECIFYAGTTEFEKVEFTAGTDEANALVDALASSKNFKAEVIKSGTVTLQNVSQSQFTKGTDPQVTNGDYSNAFKQVEAYEFNTICVDTEDTSVHLLLQSFINRIFDAASLTQAELVFMGELWSGCKYPDEVLDWMKSNYEIESCLTAEVYRSSLGDCTNNGISSYARELYILDAQKGPFEPDDIRQCVYIEKREIMGQEYVDCKPAYCRKRWYMAGGNILYTSDSRFKQITGISYPIAIHDRYEGR